MEAFIIFLVRASLYLLVFGLGYFLLLAREKANVFNRFYILLSFLLSLGLAGFGNITVNLPSGLTSETITMLLPEVVMSTGSGYSGSGSWLNGINDFALSWGFVSIVIMCIFAVSTLLKILNLARLIKDNPREDWENLELVTLPENHSPFSFFHWIFIPENLRQSEHFRKVLTHEKAHYQHRHSWDVMFMEIARLLFWFHPMYYYLKRDLQIIHEYDADNYALKEYSRADYQIALLDFALGAHYLPITNPFNVSTIKKRFIMMNKNQHPRPKVQLFRLLLIFPFVAAIFFLQSCNITTEEVSAPATEENVKTTPTETPAESDPIFMAVEESPEFPGGTSELMKFLQNNLKYPENAKAKGIQGTVFVSFVVEKDGSISNSSILRGIENGADLDAEAIRVVKMMPNWVPGKQRGEAVRVQFTLPIRYVLE